jgi:succinate dehydrogenase / fumarate reductase membrane anchor subunit
MADYRTSMSRAVGLGAAGGGTEHWWAHRISSIALIPLTILALPPLIRTIGGGYEAVQATYGNLWNATIMALLILVTFRHLQHGLQAVVEDYVHQKVARTTLILLNTWFCGLFAVAGVFAVAKIALSA